MNGIPDFDPKEIRLNIDPTLGNVRFTPNFSSTDKVGELGLDGGLNDGRIGDGVEISDENTLCQRLIEWVKKEKPTSFSELQEHIKGMSISNELMNKALGIADDIIMILSDPADPRMSELNQLNALYKENDDDVVHKQLVQLAQVIYGQRNFDSEVANNEAAPVDPNQSANQGQPVGSSKVTDRENPQKDINETPVKPEADPADVELCAKLTEAFNNGEIKYYHQLFDKLRELAGSENIDEARLKAYADEIEKAVGSDINNPNMEALNKLSLKEDDNIVRKTLIQLTQSVLGQEVNLAKKAILDGPQIKDKYDLADKLEELYKIGEIKSLDDLYALINKIADPSLKSEIRDYIEEIKDLGSHNIDALEELYEQNGHPVHRTIIRIAESVYRDNVNADSADAYLQVTLGKKTYSEKMAALEGDERFYTVTFSGGEGNQPRHGQKELNDLPLALLHSQMVSDMTAYMMELKDKLQGKSAKEQQKIIIEHHEQIVGGKDKEFEDFVKDNKSMLKFQSGLEGRKKAVEDRKQELTKIKYKDIEKELGKDLTNKLQKYIKFDPTEENYQEKEFDLSKLSDVIRDCVGEDYLINHQVGWDDETKNIMVGLNAHFQGKVDSITEEEALKLAKFCRFEEEGRDHTLGLGDLFKSGANGAMAAGVGHAIANTTSSIHVHVKVIQNLINQLNLDSAAAQALEAALAGNLVDVDVTVVLPFFSRLGVAMGTGALSGVLASLLIKVIIGEVKLEEECFPKGHYKPDDPNYDIKKNYELTLKKSGLYETIKPLLDQYPERADGTWDARAFFDELELIAGIGSNLNCNEILAAILNHKTKPKPDKPATADRTGILFEDSKVEPGKVTGFTQEQEETIQRNYAKVYNVNSSDWYAMVDLYPCLAEAMHDKPGEIKRAKRAIAIIQGGDPRYFDYNDTELINRIVDLSFQYQANKKKGRDNSEIIAELEKIPNFDWKVAWAHWQHYQTHRRLPKSLAGCVRDEITKENLKAKRKYTQFANKADVQRNLTQPAPTSPAVIITTPGTVTSYAKAKYIDETGKVVTIEAKNEQDARQKLEEQGIAKDKISVAKDQKEFDKFGEKAEGNK